MDTDIVPTTSRNYSDVLSEWASSPDAATPSVTETTTFTARDGNDYTVDGRFVQLQHTQHEKEIAELIARTFGGEIFLLPKINYPQGVPTADFRFRGEDFDLKTIKVSNKNTIYNRIKNSVEQADNFIIDITMTEYSEADFIRQIENVFSSTHTKSINTVIVVRNNEVIGVYKRATKKKRHTVLRQKRR